MTDAFLLTVLYFSPVDIHDLSKLSHLNVTFDIFEVLTNICLDCLELFLHDPHSLLFLL